MAFNSSAFNTRAFDDPEYSGGGTVTLATFNGFAFNTVPFNGGAASSVGSVTLIPGGIHSTQVGTPSISVGSVTLIPGGIHSTQVGTPSLSLGTVTITLIPTGISSTQVGTPSLSLGSVTMIPTGIHGTSVGTPAMTLGSATMIPGAIRSTQVGSPSMILGSVVMIPGAVTSTVMGTPWLILNTYTSNYLTEVFQAVMSQIVAITGLDDSQVALSLVPKPNLLPVSDPFITITPGQATVIQEQATGMGNYGTGWLVSFIVNIHTRNAMDRAYRDPGKLTHTSLGSIPTAESVYNALQLHFPIDDNNNSLTQDGIRFSYQSQPETHEKSREWLLTRQAYEVTATIPVNRTGASMDPSVLVSPGFSTGGYMSGVLHAVRSQILAMTTLSEDQVDLSLNPSPSLLSCADAWVGVAPGRADVVRPQATGMGNYGTGWTHQVYVNIFARNATDQEYMDTEKLTDATLGLITRSESVYNALQMIFPVDLGGNLLAQQPMRLLYATEPARYDRSPEWSYITHAYEVVPVVPVTRINV